MSMDTMKVSVQQESKGKKICMLIGKIIHLVFAVIVGGVFIAYNRNVNDL